MAKHYIEVGDCGSKFYYKDKKMTKLHREDGPAYEGGDGSKEWWVNGKLHREDGPAIEGNFGYKEWWLNDVQYFEDEFKRKVAKELVVTLEEIAEKFGVEVSKLKIRK